MALYIESSADKRKLERLQEKGLKVAFNDGHSSCQNLLSKANLPTLYNRGLQNIAIFISKVKQGIC